MFLFDIPKPTRKPTVLEHRKEVAKLGIDSLVRFPSKDITALTLSELTAAKPVHSCTNGKPHTRHSPTMKRLVVILSSMLLHHGPNQPVQSWSPARVRRPTVALRVSPSAYLDAVSCPDWAPVYRTPDASPNDEAIATSRDEPKKKKKTRTQKLVHGTAVAPLILTAPLYGIGFGLLGHHRMWWISKKIYGCARPTELHLHTHFDKLQRYLASGLDDAKAKSRSYRIHPTFGGLSIVSTALLAFADRWTIEQAIGYRSLVELNAVICVVSSLASFPLASTMMGDRSSRKWIKIQGWLSVVFAVVNLVPGTTGRISAHLNWALIFSTGVLERLYVLSFLSQFGARNKKEYLQRYSPHFKIAT